MKNAALTLLAAALVPACGTTKPVHINRDIYTVAVLWPANATQYPEAANRTWPYIESEMGRRGYRLVPRGTVQAFYDAKNFKTDGGEINQFTPQELGKEFKCDALVYSTVNDWGVKNLFFHTELRVGMEARIVDGRDGQNVWDNEGAYKTTSTATHWKSALAETLRSQLADLEGHAANACANCFRRLPLPGYEPKPEESKK